MIHCSKYHYFSLSFVSLMSTDRLVLCNFHTCVRWQFQRVLSWSGICATSVIAKMSRIMCDRAYNIKSKKNTNRLPQLFRSLLPLDRAVYLHTKHRRSHITAGRLRCRLRIRRLADVDSGLPSAFSGCRMIVCFAC